MYRPWLRVETTTETTGVIGLLAELRISETGAIRMLIGNSLAARASTATDLIENN
jgi:hypothetical protein